MDKEIFDKRFQVAEDFYFEAGRSRDKIILLVSTGIFVLTINLLAFFDSLIIEPYWLIGCWIASGITVFLQTFGWEMSMRSAEFKLEYMIQNRREPQDNIPKYKLLNKLINWSNYISWIAISAAVVILIIFASKNLLFMSF